MKPRKLAALCVFLVLSLLLASANAREAKQYVEITQTATNVSALQPGRQAVAAVVINVLPGYHTQSHKPHDDVSVPMTIDLDANPGITFHEPIYPPGQDEKFSYDPKPLSVYVGKITLYIPFEVKPGTAVGDVKISGKINYQACSDKECFFPTAIPFSVESKIVAAGEKVESQNTELFKNLDPKLLSQPAATAPATQKSADMAPPSASGTTGLPTTADVDQPFLLESIYSTSELKSVLTQAASGEHAGKLAGADWSISYAFGVAFVVGLLFNIMPCVLPVLPLKAIGFYEVGQHQRSKSFLFGLVFSLGIIAVFAILAVPIVVLKKISWGQLFSEWWFIWPMVGVLIAMAFGLFGAFTFRLPIGAYNFEPRHDTYSGNFLLGGFTAILATPCTAPLLPPLLVWAASQPTYGVPAMLMVGVGMASPYLILSALPELARKFPRTGPWSELFKQMMGFMLLAAAAFFAAGQIIHSVNYWWIVFAVVVVAGAFLMVRTVQLAKSSVSISVSSVLAVMMVGVALWWTVRVTAAARISASATALGSFQPYSPELFDSLRKQNKIVLVKFTANWCATCQVIEGTVFTDPAAWNAIRDNSVVALKADFSRNNPAGQALLNHLSTSGGIPLTAVYPPLENKAGKKAVASRDNSMD